MPVLGADTIDAVVLPWITENWSEAVRLSEGYTHYRSLDLRGHASRPIGLDPYGSHDKTMTMEAR